jgi:Sir2- and TIR-associating SLOG family/SIR2-like domain
MPLSRQQLISDFVSAMREGDAALFIGAGMSRPAGYLDWKSLLRECAIELGLDIDREHDLVAVAQYYLNRRNRDRARLNKILKREFSKQGTFTENHSIIGQLPIDTVWTTNFDHLLEKAFEKEGKNVDVKWRDQQIPTAVAERDVTLYKMHGDIANPDEVIICKDDYEHYARRHELFQNQLASDLLSKTFLFLGFSFTDPHLDYMLGHLRSLLEDSKREHFAIMRRVRFNEHNPNKSDALQLFDYETNKQALQIEDLQRYSIHTHLIDGFTEVTEILKELQDLHHLRNVFVSGSAHEFGAFGEDRTRDLCVALGERLIDEGYKLINGMGLSVGDSVIKGAVLKLYERGHGSVDKRMALRPFPRKLPVGMDEKTFNRRYREQMIADCGFAVFIAGTSRSNNLSAGVMEEFEIVRKLGKIPIPIGATGFAAARIWEQIESEIENIYHGTVSMETYRRLNNPALTNGELLDTVFDIMWLFLTRQGYSRQSRNVTS